MENRFVFVGKSVLNVNTLNMNATLGFSKGLFLSNNLQICVREHFFEVIHPPHRCGWLDGTITAQ